MASYMLPVPFSPGFHTPPHPSPPPPHFITRAELSISNYEYNNVYTPMDRMLVYHNFIQT